MRGWFNWRSYWLMMFILLCAGFGAVPRHEDGGARVVGAVRTTGRGSQCWGRRAACEGPRRSLRHARFRPVLSRPRPWTRRRLRPRTVLFPAGHVLHHRGAAAETGECLGESPLQECDSGSSEEAHLSWAGPQAVWTGEPQERSCPGQQSSQYYPPCKYSLSILT